jgi:hypothetical protein
LRHSLSTLFVLTRFSCNAGVQAEAIENRHPGITRGFFRLRWNGLGRTPYGPSAGLLRSGRRPSGCKCPAGDLPPLRPGSGSYYLRSAPRCRAAPGNGPPADWLYRYSDPT